MNKLKKRDYITTKTDKVKANDKPEKSIVNTTGIEVVKRTVEQEELRKLAEKIVTLQEELKQQRYPLYNAVPNRGYRYNWNSGRYNNGYNRNYNNSYNNSYGFNNNSYNNSYDFNRNANQYNSRYGDWKNGWYDNKNNLAVNYRSNIARKPLGQGF